jgi:hypothetical protein
MMVEHHDSLASALESAAAHAAADVLDIHVHKADGTIATLEEVAARLEEERNAHRP